MLGLTEPPSRGLSPATKATHVAVRNVSMLYATAAGNPTWALWRVSFGIAPTQFVCAVGPSGCGKTTLLNMLAGFVRPTRGNVRIDGREVTGPSPERGVVFQEYGLFPWLTVRGNVEFGLCAS